MQASRRPNATRLVLTLCCLLLSLAPARGQLPEPQRQPFIQVTPSQPDPPGASPQGSPLPAPAVPADAQPAPQAAGEPASAIEPVPAARPLAPPTSQAALQAWQVLDKHCAHCHQAGRLKRPAPAAGFGNILRFDDIAADQTLVEPGNPDASRLYTHMLRRLMPFDVHQEGATGEEPSADELAAVRAWITGLPQQQRACSGRQPVTKDQIASALSKIVASAGSDAGPSTTRFVSLAHLYNACASDEAMYAWRRALVVLFNSLSWRSSPVRVEAVDEARTLFKVDIAALGWVAAHWDRIVQSAPNAAGNLIGFPQAFQGAFKTAVPVVRGDWLATVAMRAPTYYDLLGLPESGPEIAKILQLDVEAYRRNGTVQRAGVRPSQVMRGGRVAERVSSSRSVLWSTFDAQPKEGQKDISEQPAAAAPPHDASLGMFLLPNGFPAFYALAQRGIRVDRLPSDVARKSVAPRSGPRAGLDCMGCHASGPQITAPAGGAATGLFASAAVDRETVQRAHQNARLAPNFVSDLGEPLTALARQYARPLTFERLRAELGVSADVLADLGKDSSSPVGSLARRAQTGTVPRSEVEAEWQNLLAALQSAPARQGPRPSFIPVDESAEAGPILQLLSDKVTYKTGDALSLTVKTSADCYLTLISLDVRGRGTVIYPSDFEQNNLLIASRTLRLPGEGAPYVFRLRDPGRERIVALCSPAGGAVDGIRHDFERQRFTDLGDYGTFLTQATAADIEARRGKAQTPAEPRRRARSRNRNEQSEQRPKLEQISRTAITIVVE